MFPGQGAQHVDMGLDLYRSEAVFREQVDLCSNILTPHLGFDLRDVLYPNSERRESAAQELNQTATTQPALFVIEYALAKLLMGWGIKPQAMVGHSVGEFVAACLAEVFSLEDALALVVARGRLMNQLPGGSMLAVPLANAEVSCMLGSELSLAAVNAPSLTVVSGPTEAIAQFEEELGKRGLEGRRLHTSHAFHSPMMDPILEQFAEAVRKVKCTAPTIPYLSNVTGTWITDAEAMDPNYWTRHLRQTVHFAESVGELLKEPARVLLEIGPGQSLTALAKQQASKNAHHVMLSSMRHLREAQSDEEFLLGILGKLWLAGAKIDWGGFYGQERRHRLPLPTYPFERQRYWVDPKKPPALNGALSGGTAQLIASTEDLRARVEGINSKGAAQQNASPPTSLHSRPELETAFVAPRNETEQTLIRIWQELFGLEGVGVDDDFFDLGGHSLLATQVVSKVRETFGVDVPLRCLFDAPTVAGLAERIESARRSEEGFDAPPIVRVSRAGDLPLSFAQQRLWFLDQLMPGSIVYNISGAARLTGPLNVVALEQSLTEVLRRHEILRTTFRAVDGQPFQSIASAEPFILPVTDLECLPEAEREAEARRLATEQAHQPFDLANGPLFRTTLLRLGEEDHILQCAMHHAVSDGWSIEILNKEIGSLYQSFSTGQPSPLPELSIQYADFAHWQRQWLQGEVLETQLSYWKKQLAGAPPSLDLPTDRRRPAVPTFHGARQSVVLSKSLTEALKGLSRQEGVTLFMTLLAAFKVLLSRYTGQEDIVVGTPIAGRNRAEIEGLIGFFVNTLVLRTNLSGNPTFKELLSRVREVALGAYDHQDVPFEKLVEELQPQRDLSRTPLFQVFFNMLNLESHKPELYELTAEPLLFDIGSVKFDLSLTMVEGTEGFTASLQYNSDLFDDTTIDRMICHFQTMLQGIVANPGQWLSDLPILTNTERLQLLVEWNETKRDFPKDKCIYELFEAQVERTPEATAVVYENQRLTYRELNIRANQLAHYLRKLGVGPEVLVGICTERSLEMVVGLLGILKAGGAYVPLDPAYPKERLAFMLEDTRLPVLLTQQPLVERVPAHWAKTACLDTDWEIIARENGKNFANETTADNLAYMIYTSGSTGRPKGVLITHRAICNHLLWRQEAYPLTEYDRFLHKASPSFDISVWEIFAPLMAGARLVLARPGGQTDSAYLVQLVVDQKITNIHFPPAMLRLLLEEKGITDCSSLRRVFCGGESIPIDLKESFFAARLNADLYYQYGPTETTVDVTTWQCKPTDSRAVVPIGCPIANTQLYILDAYLQPVPIGVPGELHVGGVSLARGYLNRPDLTQEKFIPDPFSDEPGARLYKTGDQARYLPDGTVEFLGRVDQQVKIRGFRVELGEIETVLSQHAAVRETVVLFREDTPGDKRLVAYFVPDRQPGPTVTELHNFLREKVPDYMVPSSFIRLETLRLMSNGKVDRQALRPPSQNRPELEESFVPPRTPVEQVLEGIWARLLHVKQVGIHDDFFDLGGHSLLAVRLFAEIEKEFNKRLPLSSLFKTATIDYLAGLLGEPTPSNGSSSLVAIQSRGAQPPFFCIHDLFGDVLCYMNLARRLGEDQPFYALQARGLNNREAPCDDIETMAAHYVEEIRTVQPEGPYALGGLCFGGVVAFEVARQLRTKGETVGLVALLDSEVDSKLGSAAWWWSFLHNLPRDFPSWVAGALQLTRSQWLDLIRLKITRAKAELAVSFRSTPERSKEYSAKLINEMGDLFHFSEQHREVARAQSKALRNYRPRIYPGRITLFRARMQPFFSSHDPEKGWGKLAAGGLDVRVVPGNHLGMLQEPHIRILAEQLRTCLDRTLTEMK